MSHRRRAAASPMRQAPNPTPQPLTPEQQHIVEWRDGPTVVSEAGMPARPDVLDGIGQYLLLRDLRPQLELVYHSDWSFAEFVKTS